MGKPIAKKKKHSGSGKTNDTNSKHEHGPKVFDEDTTVFIDMSQDMKEEGNKLFQKRDYEGALLKYEKAIKLLPKTHIDVAYLRSNLAACYMQMGPEEYHHAIHECNLALEVSPKYTKALLKRARCYEALNRLEAAYRDIDLVLSLEPNNLTALEISDRVKKAMEKKGINLDDKAMNPLPEVLVVKEKHRKKKHRKADKVDKAEDKVIVEVSKCNNDLKIDAVKKEEPMRAVKFIFGEDIRVAQIPANCSLMQLRDTVGNRFPSLKAVLIKYKDKEGDLVTITSSEELRWAEESADPLGSIRLYISEVTPEHEPLFGEGSRKGSEVQLTERSLNSFSDDGSIKNDEEKAISTSVDNWVVQFARLFQNHVGFSSDSCLDLHELGMKLYSEAMEDVCTSEEAQEIFDIAEEKFREMAALALFNWGNVHMSRARKRIFLPEDASRESVLEHVKSAYEWAKGEYVKAGMRYEDALKIKPDFYEGLLALGQQQFEQAKLSWYYAIGSKVDLDTWPSTEVLELFNNAEENMEGGTEMWEEIETQRLKNLSKPNKEKDLLEKMGLDGFFKDISSDEAAEQASNMRSQINLLMGTMLYERSIVEFKLGLPVYEDCLMAAVEKFKLAGATPTDLAVMIKNHCANESALDGLNFKIDEIVQAWNEMYDAKRWMTGSPSFRLEPLFRRRVPKLHSTLEQI
ncbi:HSP-interacting protein [Iris pallida]|uniref:HSP-interacting protein n=1 Tax=Iris pallida TaxID=29817 RepID=A0AAX6GKI0_IRIPA|nr:HSP-interacting protein [Iris pallida]